MKYALFGAALAVSLSSPAFAAAVNPPGSINLSQAILAPDGSPLKDDSTREAGLVVLVPFSYATADGAATAYKVGDKITDPALERDVVAYLKSLPGAAKDTDRSSYVGPIDPACAKCEPETLGKALALVLTTPVCPGRMVAGGQSVSKPAQCTADEEKAEADPKIMAGRQDEAKRLRSKPYAVLGPKSIGQLKDWASATLRPEVAEQVIRAIDPTWTPTEWGKE